MDALDKSLARVVQTMKEEALGTRPLSRKEIHKILREQTTRKKKPRSRRA